MAQLSIVTPEGRPFGMLRHAETMEVMQALQEECERQRSHIRLLTAEVERHKANALDAAQAADDLAQRWLDERDNCPVWLATVIAVVMPVVGYLFRVWLERGGV